MPAKIPELRVCGRIIGPRKDALIEGESPMKKLLLAAALIIGGLSLIGNTTPLMAQGGGGAGGGASGGGAGGDISTPQKSVPRVGIEKRDDSMNAGQRMTRKHVRLKKHKKMKHHGMKHTM
jgi:hypothetical protein